MKGKFYLGTALLALLTIILYGTLAGGPFLQLTAGPQTDVENISLDQLEGNYITYEVTHPVVSFADEYYSGDSDRVSKTAFVTYDEERQAFLKIVVPEHKSSGLKRLQNAVNRSEELKASWGEQQAKEERPVPVSGSLMAITDADTIQEIIDAMTGSDSASTPEMNDLALAQANWFVLESGSIDGISTANLRICAIAVGAALLVLFICLLSFGKQKGKSAGGKHAGMRNQMLEAQRAWLEPWCEKNTAARRWQSVGFLIVPPVLMTALGFFAGGDIKTILSCHLAIGLTIGELCGVVLLAGSGAAFNPDKIIKTYEKHLNKALPSPDEQETLARDFLAAQNQWSVSEQWKEDAAYAVLGERYWVTFFGKGGLTVMDSQRLEKMETETVSGQIRVGKVRTNYLYYTIRAYYRNSQKKKDCDVFVNFNFEDTAGRFITLARKRLGGQAEAIIQTGGN